MAHVAPNGLLLHGHPIKVNRRSQDNRYIIFIDQVWWVDSLDTLMMVTTSEVNRLLERGGAIGWNRRPTPNRSAGDHSSPNEGIALYI